MPARELSCLPPIVVLYCPCCLAPAGTGGVDAGEGGGDEGWGTRHRATCIPRRGNGLALRIVVLPFNSL